MLKTIIVLPDGSELSSDESAENVIQSASITESVNSSQELTLGSVCANMIDVKILTLDDSFSLSTGAEVAVYKADEDGTRYPVGLFTLEKPVRSSANCITVTAYDRVTWLDKDLTAWLSGLTGWPYSLVSFAQLICQGCGLTMVNESLPNGDYQIQKFTAQGITGRKLLQWVGEIAGRFCRATPEGNIEFAWYEPSGIEITPDGDRFYYQNGLTYEDYQVAPIEKVQLRLTENDVGAVWPDESGDKNTYIISGNYLLTTNTTAALVPVAQTLYEMLKNVTYTPCKVSVPASADLRAGHTVQITDRNGKSFTTCIMTRTQAGQTDTLESTGSPRRDSTAVVNNESFRALNAKMLEVRKEVEGLSVKATQIENQQIGGRNRIRNSDTLIFEDYFFSGDLVVTDDGEGNITIVTGASAFDKGDGNIILRTAAAVSDDGAGNVTLQ